MMCICTVSLEVIIFAISATQTVSWNKKDAPLIQIIGNDTISYMLVNH